LNNIRSTCRTRGGQRRRGRWEGLPGMEEACCDEKVQLVAQEASIEGMVAGIATGEGRRRVCKGERSS